MKQHRLAAAVALVGLVLAGCDAQTSEVELKTPAQKASYGIGLNMGKSLAQEGMDDLDSKAVAQGIEDAVGKKEQKLKDEELVEAFAALQKRAEERMAKMSEESAAAGKKFLEDNAKKDGVVTTASGLQYEIVKKADGPIFNNAAQAWNHTFFFLMLTPDQKPMPQKLADRIARDFGSVEAFKEEFSKAATGLFGSGWTWLAADKDGKLQIISESNAGNPMTKGLKPVMTIDVWEHAYYIDYRNRRADFIKSYWELIDWDKVADRIFPRKYHCTACDYVYDPAKGDPESGIAPGTAFEDIPDDWVCPVCGLYKDSFKIVEEK
mgnify:CR=1 FL=1